VERVHDRLRQLTLLIAGVRVLVGDGADKPGAGWKISCC